MTFPTQCFALYLTAEPVVWRGRVLDASPAAPLILALHPDSIPPTEKLAGLNAEAHTQLRKLSHGYSADAAIPPGARFLIDPEV